MISLSEPRWLLGKSTVANTSSEARLLCSTPFRYPTITLSLGSDFCDREKLEQRQQILSQQVPHLDQHTLAVSGDVGHHRWFNAAAYGRIAQIRSVIISPHTGKFQMYYLVHGHLDVSARWTGGAYAACYAESDDGIHWELPILGKHEVFRARENNVIFPPGFEANVILDLHDPDPDRRYKAFLHPGPKVAFSPDGINWTALQPGVIETGIGRSDGDSVLGWDETIGRYVAYLRPWGVAPDAPEGTPFKRKIGRAVSDDFVRWSDHTVVLEADAEDGPWAEIERMHVFRHHHLYFGLANIYQGYPEERIAISHMVAKTHCELLYSEDGIHWERFPQRTPFLSSLSGYGVCLSGGQPVLKDGLLHFYHSSSLLQHGELPSSMLPCLARLEAHRLAGWHADEQEATLETHAFLCPGGTLHVYADIGDQGHLRVAVLAEDGMHYIDHAAYRCGYAQGRGALHRITWQHASHLDQLKGEKITLKFYFTQAALYGFVFHPTQSTLCDPS